MNIRKRIWTWKGQKHTAWRLDWIDRAGRHQRQFRTRLEAELMRAKLTRERHSREYGTLLGELTLREFLPIYEQKKTWRTESYRVRVLSALRQCPFLDRSLPRITSEMIETYRDARKKKVEPATVRQDLAALDDCLKWAVKLKYLHVNPTQEVERPSLAVKQDDPATYIPPEEFEKLRAVSGRDASIYMFAVWTGLRITELILLDWQDVKDEYVIVRRGKGRKQRIVPMLPAAEQALQDIPRQMKDRRVFWWTGDRHTTLRRFQRRCAWAKIPQYKFHHLRHTFGSYAAMSGVDLEVIAAAMGHTSTTVTKLYAHLSPEYKRRELMKMADRFFPGTREVQRTYNVRESRAVGLS